jgi:hypothetical protein
MSAINLEKNKWVIYSLHWLECKLFSVRYKNKTGRVTYGHFRFSLFALPSNNASVILDPKLKSRMIVSQDRSNL